ncbi:MAG: hypothetical protein VB035_06140 [Candidatus Fimivivens sp.]|nr:hypothetical protein [Candidatus Fimivivens sp.]
MGNSSMTVESVQIERLASELSIFPRDLNTVVKVSLKSGTLAAMKTAIPKYYAIQQKKLSATHRIHEQYGQSGNTQSLQYEVIGRRLSLAHFRVEPFEHRAGRPMIEILKGRMKQAARRPDSEGNMQSPFVMKIKTKKSDGFDKNVFINAGGRTKTGKQKLKSYRTVSVPQMLAYEPAADEVQQSMLESFDSVLFEKIEKRLGIAQQNIAKGGE